MLDSPWELDPAVRPAAHPDPGAGRTTLATPRPPRLHGARRAGARYRLPLEAGARPLLVNLRAILRRHDPDLLLTTWGDTWLLPLPARAVREARACPLPLNRDPGCADRSPAASAPTSPTGRSSTAASRCTSSGAGTSTGTTPCCATTTAWKACWSWRASPACPVQTAARVSPGSGISAMQIVTALRQGVLVPWHKQQAESPKTALDLLHADQGGLVYQPLIGLHRDVAEIDFVSMYPSIMARFNISPETVGSRTPDRRAGAATWKPVDRPAAPGPGPADPGAAAGKAHRPQAQPAGMPAWDPRRKPYKARASAHKWLLVTCFGYLGYKNARFGRIEAHEAVTAYGREALLRAKEAAEDLGFRCCTCTWMGCGCRKTGASQRRAISSRCWTRSSQRTGLPIALDGIYRWVAFLPSRLDERVPVANRYFGVFQDGSLKMRGIEARRRDTPPFIAEAQMELLELLAQAPEAGGAARLPARRHPAAAPQAAAAALGRVPLEELLVAQKLSREPGGIPLPFAGGPRRRPARRSRQNGAAGPARALPLHARASRACTPGTCPSRPAGRRSTRRSTPSCWCAPRAPFWKRKASMTRSCACG